MIDNPLNGTLEVGIYLTLVESGELEQLVRERGKVHEMESHDIVEVWDMVHGRNQCHSVSERGSDFSQSLF
jgi:hypothetical protein